MYSLQRHEFSFIEHLWDTLDRLGGWKGLAALTIFLGLFYAFVMYMIQRRHKITADIKRAKRK